MYRIVEHFALGRRRLELFGEDHNIRSGWLTVGKGLSSSNFDAKVRALSVLQWEDKKALVLNFLGPLADIFPGNSCACGD